MKKILKTLWTIFMYPAFILVAYYAVSLSYEGIYRLVAWGTSEEALSTQSMIKAGFYIFLKIKNIKRNPVLIFLLLILGVHSNIASFPRSRFE